MKWTLTVCRPLTEVWRLSPQHRRKQLQQNSSKWWKWRPVRQTLKLDVCVALQIMCPLVSASCDVIMTSRFCEMSAWMYKLNMKKFWMNFLDIRLALYRQCYVFTMCGVLVLWLRHGGRRWSLRDMKHRTQDLQVTEILKMLFWFLKCLRGLNCPRGDNGSETFTVAVSVNPLELPVTGFHLIWKRTRLLTLVFTSLLWELCCFVCLSFELFGF